MQCFIPRVDIIVSLPYLSFVLAFCSSLMSVVSPLEFLSTSLTVFCVCLYLRTNLYQIWVSKLYQDIEYQTCIKISCTVPQFAPSYTEYNSYTNNSYTKNTYTSNTHFYKVCLHFLQRCSPIFRTFSKLLILEIILFNCSFK